LFLDFIINNTLSIFSILAIFAFIVISIFLIIEMKKLKKQLNDNGVNRNNISEILNVQREILNKINKHEIIKVNEDNQNIRKEKYTENEIGDMIIDIIVELKKTTKSLSKWRGFAIIIVIILILLIALIILGAYNTQ